MEQSCPISLPWLIYYMTEKETSILVQSLYFELLLSSN